MKPIFKTSLVLTLCILITFTAISFKTVTADDPTATPTIAPTPLPSTEGTLTIWINTERAPIIEAAGKAFSAKYNIPVRIQTMGFGDVHTNFNIATPAGNGPDIIVGAHDWIGELYNNGLLAPIDLGDKAKSFDPVSIKAFTYNGQLVGVPYQVEAATVFYNKALVPTPPATWDEFKTIAKKLLDDKKVDATMGFVAGDFYGHYGLLTSFGGGVFGRDAQGSYDPSKVLLDNEGSIKAMTELDSMIKAGLLKDGVNYDVAKDLFLKGKLAMWVNGPWELDNIKKGGINYGLALIPKGSQDAHPFVGVQGFMVNKLSKNPLLAQAFLTEFLATDDIMQKLYEGQFGIPAWLPTREKVMNDDIKAFSASVANGDPMPAIPAMGSVWNAANSAFTLVYQQKAAPDAALKDAAKSIRDEIAKTK
jgi:maltose-binding protein MalE